MTILYGIDNDLSENNLREMCSDINLFFENENIEELNIHYQKMNNINKLNKKLIYIFSY